MKTEKEKKLKCGFCHKSEQGKRGIITKKWFKEWNQFIPVCQVHQPK